MIVTLESLREKLNQIYDQPGGQEAARVILGDYGVDALHEVASCAYHSLTSKMDERIQAFDKAKDDGPSVPDEGTGDDGPSVPDEGTGDNKPANPKPKRK